jgi:hypothetical protein
MFRHLGTVCQTERHPGAFCYYSTVVLQYSTALYCLKKQGPVFNIENELTKYLPCYTVQYSIHCDEHGLATCLVHSTVRYYNTVPVQYSIYSQIGSYSPLKVLICSQILQLYWQELRILIQYLLYQYSSLLYSTVHFSLMVPFNESLVSKITHRLHSRAMISILIWVRTAPGPIVGFNSIVGFNHSVIHSCQAHSGVWIHSLKEPTMMYSTTWGDQSAKVQCTLVLYCTVQELSNSCTIPYRTCTGLDWVSALQCKCAFKCFDDNTLIDRLTNTVVL